MNSSDKKEAKCRCCGTLNIIDPKRVDMISPTQTGGTIECWYCGKISGFMIEDGDMWFGKWPKYERNTDK